MSDFRHRPLFTPAPLSAVYPPLSAGYHPRIATHGCASLVNLLLGLNPFTGQPQSHCAHKHRSCRRGCPFCILYYTCPGEPKGNAKASMAASAGRDRLVSRCREDRCSATFLTTSSPLEPLMYSVAYCHEMRAHRRCLRSGETGKRSSWSARERSSSGT